MPSFSTVQTCAKLLLLANSLLKRSVLMPREQKADLQDPVPLCPTGATGGGDGEGKIPGNCAGC